MWRARGFPATARILNSSVSRACWRWRPKPWRGKTLFPCGKLDASHFSVWGCSLAVAHFQSAVHDWQGLALPSLPWCFTLSADWIGVYDWTIASCFTLLKLVLLVFVCCHAFCVKESWSLSFVIFFFFYAWFLSIVAVEKSGQNLSSNRLLGVHRKFFCAHCELLFASICLLGQLRCYEMWKPFQYHLKKTANIIMGACKSYQSNSTAFCGLQHIVFSHVLQLEM